jgi:hypothetical protein
MWENKKGLSDELPYLVYVSREKRHKHPHHYKAGALNVLVRYRSIYAKGVRSYIIHAYSLLVLATSTLINRNVISSSFEMFVSCIYRQEFPD